MYDKVSTAGIRVNEQRGLVDCSPRRFEPDGELRMLLNYGTCPLPPHWQIELLASRREHEAEQDQN